MLESIIVFCVKVGLALEGYNILKGLVSKAYKHVHKELSK